MCGFMCENENEKMIISPQSCGDNICFDTGFQGIKCNTAQHLQEKEEDRASSVKKRLERLFHSISFKFQRTSLVTLLLLLHSLSNLNYFIFQECRKHQQTSVHSLFHQIWTQQYPSFAQCIFQMEVLGPSYLCLSSLEQS